MRDALILHRRFRLEQVVQEKPRARKKSVLNLWPPVKIYYRPVLGHSKKCPISGRMNGLARG